MARDLYCYLMTIRNVIVTVTMTRTLVRKIRNWVLFVPDFNIHGLVAISFPEASRSFPRIAGSGNEIGLVVIRLRTYTVIPGILVDDNMLGTSAPNLFRL